MRGSGLPKLRCRLVPTMHVLLAEDDAATSKLVAHVLTCAGHTVHCVAGGNEAITALRRQSPDVVVTDWNMPGMNGLELLQNLRKQPVVPPVVMLTANSSLDARTRALLAGADEFLAKPARPDEIVEAVERCYARVHQSMPRVVVASKTPPARACHEAPFPVMVVASSTGGPDALRTFLPSIPASMGGAILVVQHAPAFIMDAMLHSMQRETDRTVHLGAKDMAIEEGHVYLAPGDHHMQVSANSRKLEINQGPPENYVRPAADPLFRSAARAFGSKVVAVVLTGPGRDGSHGCAEVRLAGGRILVQDPATAVAPPMPRSVIEAGLADEVVPLAEIGRAAALALSSLGSRVRV